MEVVVMVGALMTFFADLAAAPSVPVGVSVAAPIAIAIAALRLDIELEGQC